jgi:hypothetical protein
MGRNTHDDSATSPLMVVHAMDGDGTLFELGM